MILIFNSYVITVENIGKDIINIDSKCRKNWVSKVFISSVLAKMILKSGLHLPKKVVLP